jgi:hypothetical protein
MQRLLNVYRLTYVSFCTIIASNRSLRPDGTDLRTQHAMVDPPASPSTPLPDSVHLLQWQHQCATHRWRAVVRARAVRFPFLGPCTVNAR